MCRKVVEILWNVMESDGTLWKVVDCVEMLWNVWECQNVVECVKV